jgi:hypothetical protein
MQVPLRDWLPQEEVESFVNSSGGVFPAPQVCEHAHRVLCYAMHCISTMYICVHCDAKHCVSAVEAVLTESCDVNPTSSLHRVTAEGNIVCAVWSLTYVEPLHMT